MANTSSAKKAARVSVRRAETNQNRRSSTKTAVRKVEEAISSGDVAAAKAALKAAEPTMVRTAQKGVLHKNAVARKVSRLSARVKAMQA